MRRMAGATEGGERESLLLKGVLDLCVLTILEQHPQHAYGVVQALQDRGFDQTSYGTVYPLVTRLRRLGLVVQKSQPSAAGPARNVLSVTDAGRVALGGWVGQWRSVTSRVAAVIEPINDKERVDG